MEVLDEVHRALGRLREQLEVAALEDKVGCTEVALEQVRKALRANSLPPPVQSALQNIRDQLQAALLHFNQQEPSMGYRNARQACRVHLPSP